MLRFEVQRQIQRVKGRLDKIVVSIAQQVNCGSNGAAIITEGMVTGTLVVVVVVVVVMVMVRLSQSLCQKFRSPYKKSLTPPCFVVFIVKYTIASLNGLNYFAS